MVDRAAGQHSLGHGEGVEDEAVLAMSLSSNSTTIEVVSYRTVGSIEGRIVQVIKNTERGLGELQYGIHDAFMH